MNWLQKLARRDRNQGYEAVFRRIYRTNPKTVGIKRCKECGGSLDLDNVCSHCNDQDTAVDSPEYSPS